MSYKKLRPFIVEVSVLGYFPLLMFFYKYLIHSKVLVHIPLKKYSYSYIYYKVV